MPTDVLLLTTGGTDSLLLTTGGTDDLLLSYAPNEIDASAIVTITGTMGLDSSGTPIAAVGAITVTATMGLNSSADAMSMAGTITLTGTLALGRIVDLWPDPGTITLYGGLSLPPTGTRRRIVAVNMDGTPLGEFENALTGTVQWELNEPDRWNFTIPKSDPKAELVHAERFRECQLWRGDQLLSWGPITRPGQATEDFLEVQGSDCLWYLSRRNIGKADRFNHVVNPSFEDGLGGWSIDYESPLEPVANRTYTNFSYSITGARAVKGARSLLMTQPAAAAPQFGITATQFIIWTVDPAENPDGDEWTFAAHCYIPDAGFLAPPYEDQGLRITRYSTTETVTLTAPGGEPIEYPAPIETRVASIGHDTPRDVWTTLDVTLIAPFTGDPEFVRIWLFCPLEGSIYWDACYLARAERLAFFGEDQATIATEIVEHLQDPAFDKSDLNIDTSCPATGVLRDRIYLHSEHPPGLRALEEFTRLADGFDHRIEYTPTTRTYTTEFPASGRWRPKAGLELGGNIASYRWTFDGEAAASSVVTLGQGPGNAREEGFATDTGDYANDLILEEVFVAPPDSPIEHLDALAEERLDVTLNPEILEVTTVPITDSSANRLLGYVRKGDVIPVTIRDQELNIEGDRYRIVSMTLNPDDTLSLTLNRREVNT